MLARKKPYAFSGFARNRQQLLAAKLRWRRCINKYTFSDRWTRAVDPNTIGQEIATRKDANRRMKYQNVQWQCKNLQQEGILMHTGGAAAVRRALRSYS